VAHRDSRLTADEWRAAQRGPLVVLRFRLVDGNGAG